MLGGRIRYHDADNGKKSLGRALVDLFDLLVSRIFKYISLLLPRVEQVNVSWT